MKYLPIGLNVTNKRCLVVGGGTIGERKVKNLLRAGAEVLLVSPETTPYLADLEAKQKILRAPELFGESHLDGVFLAVVATDDEEVNASVVKAAISLGILVCDASSADRSQVIFGALHLQEGFTVAVFSDGEDPSRARKARDRISNLLSTHGERTSPDPD
jgi:siroheme synthase-like protein